MKSSSKPYQGLPPEYFQIVDSFRDPFYYKWVSRGAGTGPKFGRPPDKDSHRKWVGSDAGSGLPFKDSCYFQLEFMISRGLNPESQFLDIGCGCLRGGRHFIDFLNPEKYCGVDISAEVVFRGIQLELGSGVFQKKKPSFVISNRFNFTSIRTSPRYVLAGSLFTHLPIKGVSLCLRQLYDLADGHSVEFFATFSEVYENSDHLGESHYLGGEAAMTYTRSEMHEVGSECGWDGEYLGPWGHPKNKFPGPYREQMMFRFYIS